MRTATLLLALPVALAAAGCDGDASERSAGAPTDPEIAAGGPPPIVDCATRTQFIPTADPERTLKRTRRSAVTAGPVTFVGALDRETDSGGGEFADQYRFKVPILVDAGATVTISIAESSRENATLDVGRDRGGSVKGPAVSLRPCRPGDEVDGRPVGASTPFAAGFRLEERACVEVEVSVGSGATEPTTARLPLGEPCPGS